MRPFLIDVLRGILISTLFGGALWVLLLVPDAEPTPRPAPINVLEPEPGDVSPPPRDVSGLNRICWDPLSEEERREADKIFDRLLHRHRARRENPRRYCAFPRPRFDREANHCHREARLFSLAYPRLALERSIGVTRDPEAYPRDRYYSVRILGCLAAAGWRPAKQELLSLTYSEPLSGHALRHLLRSDSRGDYRDRYKELAREGNTLAVHALGMWPDEKVSSLFNEVLKRTRGLPFPEGACATYIGFGREKQFLMKSDEWRKRAREILSGDAEDGWWYWRDWAYLVARRHGLPGLKELLRARLDRALENAKLRSGSTRFHKTDQIWYLTRDSYYDDTLVKYADLGGTLKEPERRRLEYFGYVGDPRQRLEEVLTEE